MDWRECIKKRIVKNIKEDRNLISSLIKTSENKLKSSEELSLNEINSPSKISLSYESLREILEALAIKNNFKIYNHECYTTFLKEILNKKYLAEEFDRLRKIRNSINYYAKEISIKDTKDILIQIKKLRKEILKLLG